MTVPNVRRAIGNKMPIALYFTAKDTETGAPVVSIANLLVGSNFQMQIVAKAVKVLMDTDLPGSFIRTVIANRLKLEHSNVTPFSFRGDVSFEPVWL